MRQAAVCLALCCCVCTSVIAQTPATSRATDSLKLLVEISIDTARVNAFNALAKAYDDNFRYAAADSAARQALELAEKLGYANGEARARHLMGLIFSHQGIHANAIDFYKSAAAIYERLGDEPSAATSLHALGNALKNKGKYADATEAHQKALSIRRALGLKKETAISLGGLAGVYENQGKYAEGLELCYEALRLAEDSADKKTVADALNNLGSNLTRQKRFDDALPQFQRALKLREELGEKTGIANALNNLGSLNNQMGNYPAALEYLKKTLALDEESGNKMNVAYSLNNIGYNLQKQEKYEESQTYFLRSLTLLQEIGSDRISSSLDNISVNFQRLQEFNKALPFAQRAFLLAKKNGNNLQLRDATQSLSNIYEHLNQPDSALAYLRLHLTYKDSALNAETAKATARMKEQYESEKKQRDLESLAKANELQRLESERQRGLFIGGFIILGLAVALIAFAYRQKQQSEQALKERNKLVEAQKELAEEKQRIVEAQRDELFKANKLKTELLAIASHDLKNPLQAIIGLGQIISEDAAKDSALKGRAETITRAGKRMHKLILDLLDTAALDSGSLVLNKMNVSLDDLVREVVEANRPLAEQKLQTLTLDIDSTVVALVDAARIREVFENIVGNAIKYAPKEKAIRIALKQTPTLAVFSARDEGQGLSNEDMQKLFGRFQRLSARPTGGEASTGLGLSIAKEFVELHGGRIWAESKGKGFGATFFVELPLRSLETSAATAAQRLAAQS